jgi:hypothetical protein
MTTFLALSSFTFFSQENPKVSLEIKTEEVTNGGMPFYVLVKEVEKGEFLNHIYPDILREAFPSNGKVAASFSQVVIPGKKCHLEYPRQKPDKPLGIYFLLTQPGEDWKMLVDATETVKIVLRENNIKIKTE